MDKNRIEDMPKDMRPYEKCFSHGVSALTDVELVSVILKNGYRGQNVLALAREILEKPGKKGLSGLLEYSQNELQQFKGIGNVKAIELMCVAEIARRLMTPKTEVAPNLNEPEHVYKIMMPLFKGCKVEQVWVLCLNNKNKLIEKKMIFQGAANECFTTPPEIFRTALLCGAVSIILVHNHPSGDPTPSKEDFLLTKRVVTSGELVGIHVLDHIIIGNHSYYSLQQEGYIK